MPQVVTLTRAQGVTLMALYVMVRDKELDIVGADLKHGMAALREVAEEIALQLGAGANPDA